MFTRHFIITACICTLTASAVAPAVAAPRQDARLLTATQVLTEFQASPDRNAPRWLLERAYGVAIVPGVIKVGLLAGARRGSGVLVVRKDDGHWSNPVFINLTGGSFGLQVGVQSTDVVLVFTSRQSIEGIVGGKLTLGADASAAAGPVGRQTGVATDVGLTAQVYSYSRAQGLFAGIALDGSALTIDRRSNEAYYGRSGLLASDIIAGNAPQPPDTARQFVASLDRALGVATLAPRNTSPNAGAISSTSPSSAAHESEPGKLTTHPMEDPNPGKEPPP